MFSPDFYYTVLAVMFCLAAVVFVCLLRFKAGYGMLYTPAWGPALPNRAGWVLMEAPAFTVMLLLWVLSRRACDPTPAVMAALFELHYFQRSFIFPFLMRGKSRMPLAIILMGMVFNSVNAYMIGGWLFYVAPDEFYTLSWLWNPLFILGVLVFFAGMAVNIHSDSIIRRLRKPGDTRHHIPRGGMFRYVTSANYLGELTEWAGFAILTWSAGALAFLVWTFANLAPRSRTLHRRYITEFGDDYAALNRRYLIPFIY